MTGSAARRLRRLACGALTLVLGIGTRDARAHSDETFENPLTLLLPDYLKLQSGGYSGAVTAGCGYAAFEDRLNAAVLYGYVPPHGGRSVQSLHVLFSLRLLELGSRTLRWLPLYAGLGALYTWGGAGYFLVVPARYPSGYYFPTALRLTAHIGSEFDWLPPGGVLERHGLYAELTTLDVFAFEYLKNPGLLDLADVVSSSIGYRAAF